MIDQNTPRLSKQDFEENDCQSAFLLAVQFYLHVAAAYRAIFRSEMKAGLASGAPQRNHQDRLVMAIPKSVTDPADYSFAGRYRWPAN